MKRRSDHYDGFDPTCPQIKGNTDESPHHRKTRFKTHGEHPGPARRAPGSPRYRSSAGKPNFHGHKCKHTSSLDTRVRGDMGRWDIPVETEHRREHLSPSRGSTHFSDAVFTKHNLDDEQIYNILITKYDYVTRENT